jgi:hypothetical protein
VKLRFRPRILDAAAVLFAVMAVVGVTLFAYGGRLAASEVTIKTDTGTFLYPLDQERVIAADGPIGQTIIEIAGERVRVTESPCRDKICIAAGHLDETGQWTACLPNRVFVAVQGGENEDGVDAQTF